MAYDYLGLTNEVLARMNEVELTTATLCLAHVAFKCNVRTL